MKATFTPNDRVGPYELLVKLGSGGTAAVMLARRRGAGGFERLFVVKRVHRRHLANRQFLDMLRDEARLASSIRHTNVASVIDVIDEGGELCLVMEYFESVSVAALVDALHAAGEVMPAAIASRVVCDTLAGLHAAHEALDMRGQRLGIVHRDVSPQNLVVDVGGVTRIIDFGIAKAESRLTQTKSGFVKGKLGYMSPEQIEALALDRRSDLYSAAIVLHELVTGRRLFPDDDDEFSTMRRVLAGDIPAASAVRGDLPVALDVVLRRALARTAADRYETGLELQSELSRAIPPAAALDVGRLVARLGAGQLGRIRHELDEVLGLDAAKGRGERPADASAHPAAAPRSTRGHTVRMTPRLARAEGRRAGSAPMAGSLVLVDSDDEADAKMPPQAPAGSDGHLDSLRHGPRGWLPWLVTAIVLMALVLAYRAFSIPYLRR